MVDERLAEKTKTRAEPTQAQPNHDREKTYQPPGKPDAIKAEEKELPERTAEDKVEKDMSAATDEVKKRL